MIGAAERTDDPDAPAGPDDDRIGRDELFKLLGNERRRHVVEFLDGRDDPVTLDRLATHVAGLENDCAPEAVTERQHKRVYTSLQQTHLPRLGKAGAVEFDKDRGTVAPSDTLTEMTLHLDVVSAGGVPESVGYLVGAGCSAALSLAVLLDVPLVSAVSPLWWAALVLCSFALVAGVRRVLQARDGPL
ncbi:MAG: hypothetical protein A07HB70_00344 [uncultured archaeon A07HB70]|nr:MAG: hypothetical protein A07HB70_00344 [uncultured archaeon A07HB70]